MGIFRSDEAIFAAKDEAVYASGTIWPAISGQTGTHIGILPSVTIPGPDIDWERYWTTGTDRESAIQGERRRSIEGIEAPIILQKAEIFRYVFDGQNSHTSRSDSTNSSASGTSNTTHSFRTASDLTIGPNASLTLDAPDLRSLTLQVSFPSGTSTSYWSRYYTGAKIDSIRLEADSESELSANVSFKAASVFDYWDAATIVPDRTTQPYLFHTATFSYRGSTVARVTEFELTINNNLKSNWYLTQQTGGTSTIGRAGGRYLYDLIPGKREYELRAKVVIDSELNPSIWNSLLNGAEFSANFLFERTAGTTASNADRLQIFLEGVVFKKAPHSVPEDKADIPVDIDATARKGYVVVVNAQAGMTL